MTAAEATAWHVAAWTCESCGGVSLIMDPGGDGEYDCDDCGKTSLVSGVDG